VILLAIITETALKKLNRSSQFIPEYATLNVLLSKLITARVTVERAALHIWEVSGSVLRPKLRTLTDDNVVLSVPSGNYRHNTSN
jgi:hypothetical protein